MPRTRNKNLLPSDRYFYLRDRDGHPMGLVLLRVAGYGCVTATVTLCATTDRWNRDKALGLAISAYENAIHTATVRRGSTFEHVLRYADLDHCSRAKDIDTTHADRTLAQQIEYMLAEPDRSWLADAITRVTP